MDGIILFDKPKGWSSHQAVAHFRKELGIKKIGHAGTLDPFATGLLLILVGKATRLQPYLMPLPKAYLAVARLGFTSTTGDPEGEILEGNYPDSLEMPTGEVEQVPPAYSAIKIDGVPAYKRIRRGEEVKIPSRKVRVYKAELLSSDHERARYLIECSAGTYIRSLVMELNDAYCEELQRARIGHLKLEDADPQKLIEIPEAISFLPAYQLGHDEFKRAVHGRPLEAEGAGIVRMLHEKKLVAIGEFEKGILKQRVNFT